MIIKILKQVGLLGLIIGALLILGTAINAIIPWSWLTNLFIIIRKTTIIFDFMWDMDTLFTLVAISLSIQVALWLYRATVVVVNFFNEK